MMRWLSLTSILVWLLSVALPAWAVSPETVCTALGANCICSEPFEMTDLGSPFNAVWLKPNDTPTGKECTEEDGIPTGYSIAQPHLDVSVSTDATALAALPAGNTVARFLGTPEGYTGILNLGHQFTAANPTGRVALRWYRYYSPGFIFSDEGPGWDPTTGGCHASKIAQSQFSPIVDAHGDTQVAQYGYIATAGWNPSLDCCSTGPGSPGDAATYGPRGTAWLNPATCNYGSTQGGNPTSGNCGWAGAWMRFELVIGNRSGSAGIYYIFYAKNVTHGSPEYVLVDTRVAGGVWTTAAATTLTPPGRVDNMIVNAYRQNTCAGFSGFLYMLAAAWVNDAGQRIGAASEVESGAAPPTPSLIKNIIISGRTLSQ